jgi:mannose-1-phosphate guanylyltransferase
LKALLIAGGFGTRLRPLTYTRPKHLLPIANRPHIEHVLDLLARHDVTNVVLLTSYLASAFDGVIERAHARGITVEVAHEEEPLGTAGALKNAADLVTEETFFAFNGDVLTDVDLSALLEFHGTSGGLGTILLTPVEDPSAFGVVPTDDKGRVTGFIEKPPPGEATTNEINAGVYVLEPAVLDSIPSGQVVSIEREVFPGLAENGSLYARATSAYWMDIGTPAKYLQANLDALAGRFVTDAVPQPGEEASAVAPSARVADGAQVSSACIGEGCVVEEDAIIRDSVLLDGITVAAGASVTGSVLGEGVRVAPMTVVDGRTIGDGEIIDRSEV